MTKKAFIICALPALLFLPAIAENHLPFFMDIVAQFFPWRCAVARQLEAGHLPLWTSSIYAGVPLLANPQVAALYPPNWLFFALPRAGMFTALFMIHVYLLGLGTYLWLRARRFPPEPALASALVVTVSGATWAHVAFGSYLFAMGLCPWMFFMLERFRRCGKPLYFAGMCVFSAMLMLCGAIQAAYYAFILFIFLALLCMIEERFSLHSLHIFLAAFVSIIIGLGISAVQLLPTREFVAQTQRAGNLPLQMIKIGSLTFRRMLEAYLGSGTFPQDTGDVAYIGAAGLFFALWGTMASLRRQGWKDVVWWLGFLSLGVWPLSGIYARILPGFGGFHDPRRILALAPLAAAPLIARGLLSIRIKNKVPVPGRILFFFLFIMSYFFLWFNRENPNLQLWYALGFIPNLNFQFSTILSGVIFVYFLIVAFIFSKKRRGWWWILITFTILEILNYSFCRVDTKFAPEAKVRPRPHPILNTSKTTRIIAYDSSGNYSYDYLRAGNLWMPNLAACEGISDFQGYDPLRPVRYTIFLAILNEPQPLLYASHFGIVRNFNSPLIARAGITHSIGLPKDAHAENWKQITFAGEGGASIYEYVPATGRLAFESDPAVAGSLKEAAEELRWQALSGKVRGVVEEASAIAGRGGGSATIHLRELRDGFACIEVDADSEGYIFFRDGWFPGWKVFVDGKERPNLPADVAFQSVQIERGKHVVEWRYQPAILARGALISALSCILLILLILAKSKNLKFGIYL